MAWENRSFALGSMLHSAKRCVAFCEHSKMKVINKYI